MTQAAGIKTTLLSPCIMISQVLKGDVAGQWTHLEQQSFPMSEVEYMEKLDNIAFYLGCAKERMYGSKFCLLMRAPCFSTLSSV